MRKEAVKAAAWLMSACLLMGSLPASPGRTRKVSAAEPEIEGFATKEELLTDYSLSGAADKKVQKVMFGQNGRGAAQSWYIAGKDPAEENGLVLFAATPLKERQWFYSPRVTHAYEANWRCEYKNNPSQVNGNHYGGSEIRSVLKDMSSDPSYFSGAEQRVMRETAIRTADQENGSIYTTKDKLYLAQGELGSKQISVGTNEETNVNKGLKISLNQYQDGSGDWFWLRSPCSWYDLCVLAARSGSAVDYHSISINNAHHVAPALQMNLSSVIFASSAPAASFEGNQRTKGRALTMRYDAGRSLGSETILNQEKVEIRGVAANRYLVVQNKNGAWRKKVERETTVSAKDVMIDGVTLNSFKNCKVWLEKTDADRITRATRPDQTETPSAEQTFDFYGIGTSVGKDVHFAQLEYAGGDHAILHGLNEYGSQIHPYFTGRYAYIKVRSKEGKLLFFKEYKGTDWTQKHDTKIPMPEDARVSIYHAEPDRLQTNSDDSLKKNAFKNTYIYVVKDHKLVSQKLEKQQFEFLGLGDWEFAKMDIIGGSAWIDTNHTDYGPHCYFQNQVYASIIIKDQNGKVIKKKEYIGQKNEPVGSEDILLDEGYTVTIYHAEPNRLRTNNDQQLKQYMKENTFSYIYKNQKLEEIKR
ncbi:putative mucin/carbohydrate-binding domain-containing protein [Anaerostipes caccae]|uniref:putative mucin/carbohydrate-binding domain-containing protein n=1 Tax=Anaerostipes caccae TaxID=105841 RepID=UPI0038D415F3